MANESKIKVRTSNDQPVKDDVSAKPEPPKPLTPPDQQVSSHSSKVIQPPGQKGAESSGPEPPKNAATTKTDIGRVASTANGSTKLTQEELNALEQDMASNPIPGAVAEPSTTPATEGKNTGGNTNNQPSPAPQPPAGGGSGDSGAVTSPPPVTPQPSPQRRFSIKRILLVAGVVVLGVLAFWAYLQYVAPKLALARYVEDLGDFDTGNYTLQVVFRTAEEDGGDAVSGEVVFDAKAEGEFDNRDAGSGKLDASIEGSLNFGGFITGLNLEGAVDGDTIYINLGTLSVPGLFGGVGEQPDAWYSYDANQLLADSGCSEEEVAAYEEFLATQHKKHVTLSDTSRVSLLPVTVDGNRAAHYRGKVDPASVQNFLREANQQLPEHCRSDDGGIEGLDDYDIAYDLWDGRKFDRLKLVLTHKESGSTIEVTLTTQDYGQDVNIQIPADAQPFGDFNDLLQGGLPGAPPAPGPDGADFTAPDIEVEVQ